MENQAPSPAQMQQHNFMQRQAVTSNSLKLKQEIFSQTFNPANQNVINIGNGIIRNAGLLLGFIVEVSGTVTNTAGAAADRTGMGTANIVDEFRFDDLSNYTRIQCPGWYMGILNSVRQGFGYGGAYANNIPMGYGNNFDVYEGAAQVAASASQDVRHVYYVPISYSSTDLRGAMYMSTVSATSNLQITLNRNPMSAAGNEIDHIYTGNDGDWDGDVTVTVYQCYLDQLPTDENGAPILPIMDLNTIYDLKQTTFSNPTSGQDYPMPYSNFRSFLSTVAIFDNGGVYNTGSDVNYWALRSANFTNIFKVSPEIAALDARATLMGDMMPGGYLFESRDMPINTINFGNMELNLNATGVNANARVLMGYESFALQNQLVGASSLAGG